MANPLYDSLIGIHKNNSSDFIVDKTGHGLTSYTAFTLRVAQCANAIVESGLKPGDRLAAQIGKSLQSLAVYLGCVQAGVVYLPLNSAYTAAELEYFLTDSAAALLICDPESESELTAIARKHNVLLVTQSACGEEGSFVEKVNAASDQFQTIDRDPHDLAALLYTSGTTGRSKGAMLTQNNLLSNSQVLLQLWQFSDKDILLHALPVFHTHGLFVATNIILLAGAKMIFEPKFDVDRAIECLPYATTLMGVPTFYTRLLDDSRFTGELVQSMRLFISGSAPLLAETHKQFESRTGHRILERYGMTETNMNTSNPYSGDRRAGTVGFALPGIEVKITDPESGADLPDGQIGSIEVRGPNVFKGYWNMPEKTAEELRANGFFITGDLGQIDEDGYISIVGRDKDLIISGGFNIYPKEIELLLDEQTGVKESAVVGVPHPDFGETVIAILVADDQSIDLDEIDAATKTSLARFKHPRKFIVVEQLPRNAMGKVQKNILRDEYSHIFS
ncbi:MAG: malonyl-CoA synthase [Granulosicoccus sp.]